MQRYPGLIAGAVFLAMTLGIMAPVLPHLTDRVIGDEASDIWTHLWGYYWTERSLFTEHAIPLKLDYIRYPMGGVLYHIDLLNSLFMLPLKHFFGYAMGFNFLVFLQLFGCAMAMYYLAYYFTKSPTASILGAMTWAFSSFTIEFALASGVSERLNLAWMPLFFLCFIKILETNRRRYYLFAGLIFFLTSLGSWKYGFLIYCLALFFSVYRLALPIWNRLFHRSEAPANLKSEYVNSVLKQLLPLALICALFAVPLSTLAARSVTDWEAIYVNPDSKSMFWDGHSRIPHIEIFAMSDYFSPINNPPVITAMYDRLYQTAFIGNVIILLALFSMFVRKPHVRFFFPAALLFLILAMGPVFRFVRFGHLFKSPAFSLLALITPYITTMTPSWEFSVAARFCFAISAAVGFSFLLRAIKKRGWRAGLAGLAIALVLGEQLFVNPKMLPLPASSLQVPEFYHSLAQDRDQYAVFDFPLRRPFSNLIPEIYLFYQTTHGKSIPYGINESWIDRDNFWRLTFRNPQWPQPNLAETLETGERAKAYLRGWNFKYFIMHKYLLTHDRLTVATQFFDLLFGQPVVADDQLIVYRITD